MYIFINLQYILFYASEFKIVYFWDFRSKSWWSFFFDFLIKLLPSSWASIQQKLQFCYSMTGKKSRKMFGFSTDFMLFWTYCVLFMTQISKITYNLWRFNGFFFHCDSFKLTREKWKRNEESEWKSYFDDPFRWFCLNLLSIQQSISFQVNWHLIWFIIWKNLFWWLMKVG